MAGYLTKRAVQIAVTLFIFFSLGFVLIQSQPGNYCDFLLLNPNIPPDAKEGLVRLLGCDDPMWEQYLKHLRNYATGDFGVSFGLYPRSVISVIAERLPRTIMLFVTASVISFYLGFAMGKMIAWRRGSITEYAATVGGVSLFTIFTPWFALMMLWFFGLTLRWFPIGKFLDPVLWRDAPVDGNYVFTRMLWSVSAVFVVLLVTKLAAARFPSLRRRWVTPAAIALSLSIIAVTWNSAGLGYLAVDIIRHMVLPVATLTLISFAGTMLLTRNCMLETMREDYVLTARAKGLSQKQVRDRHVARNAMLPVVTSFMFSLTFAIDGGVIIETVFSWPGMGQTLVNAVRQEDIPLALGAFVFTGLLVVAAHLVADLFNMYLDPRLRHN